MPITSDFRATVWARAQKDPRYRAAMLTEAINALLSGDLGAGKSMLRDYVNATITFDGLANESGIPSKSLQRMLGPRGNPTAESLFGVIRVLQDVEHVQLQVKAARVA